MYIQVVGLSCRLLYGAGQLFNQPVWQWGSHIFVEPDL